MRKFPFETEALREWFLKEARDLPWRHNPTPYSVWVSEIMLQQTQVTVVKDYYLRWMKRFPSIAALSIASLEEVVKMWEGLGYYSRARNLHQAAAYLVENHQGDLPSDRNALLQVKGLGPYTVGAILSFAFHQRAAAVDGNVIRVLSRYYGIEEDVQKGSTLKKIWTLAEAILPESEPWLITEALIELGASVCKREANCWLCPLRLGCLAFKEGKQGELPKKGRRVEITSLSRQVFVIAHEDNLLVKKGEKGKIMADLYEFPYLEKKNKGGRYKTAAPCKIDDFESVCHVCGCSPCPAAEGILEEVDGAAKRQNGSKARFCGARQFCNCLKGFPFPFEAKKIKNLPQVQHSFTRFRVSLYPSFWRAAERKELPEHEWVCLKEIGRLPFSSGHRKVLTDLLHKVSNLRFG